MFGIDLHLHTVFSRDSTISPKVLVDQLNAHPWIKGVAITDHDTLRGFFEVQRLARAYTDLVVLPGIEVSTDKGDMLVLGVEEIPEYPVTLESAADFAEGFDAVIVVPHPYRSMGIGELALDVEAHAIEILNPTATSKENQMARKLAEIRGLPGVAGTDAHDVREMWTAFTEVEAQLTVESVLNAIRRNAVRPVDARRTPK